MGPARVPTAFASFSSIVVRGPAALVVSQMIDLLVYLVRNRGRVGKDAVIDGVWDGRIMSDWANREDAG